MDQSYLRMMMKVRHLDHPYSRGNLGLEQVQEQPDVSHQTTQKVLILVLA